MNNEQLHPSDQLSDEDKKRLTAFKQLLYDSIGDSNFKISQATKIIGLSERSLYRKFAQLFGSTPSAYLKELRLDRAKTLLEGSDVQSVEEVAINVGFNDVAYFAVVFKRHFKIRPYDLLKKRLHANHTQGQ